ncbi:MAG: metal ABC transporter permease, partial [Thermoanaerobaculia bacterium]
KDMLVGNILTVSPGTVIKTAVLYALVGVFHWIFRKKFLAISIGAHNGDAESIPNVKLWDFRFYTSFGFVVTSSVAIAGVLLVFSYLIVPSVAAMLFSQSIGKRLAIGWTMGALVSAAGIMLSFRLDLPTGATIVCTFGIALALLAVVWALLWRRRRGLLTMEVEEPGA